MIGGDSMEIEKAPYMLSMRLNDKHICGAVIIGKEWSLTAAHCCVNYLRKLSMRSGSASLDEGGEIHRVTELVRNDAYRDDDDDYDICAVRVEPSFGGSTRPVRLPEPGTPSGNLDWGVVSGWGYTEPDGRTLSPTLRSIKVSRVALADCKYAYRHSYTIHDRDVCYGSGNSFRDACQGDSGGPLVNDDSILIGLVSFGEDCGFSFLPGIYTDVVQFRSWIKNTTGI